MADLKQNFKFSYLVTTVKYSVTNVGFFLAINQLNAQNLLL